MYIICEYVCICISVYEVCTNDNNHVLIRWLLPVPVVIVILFLWLQCKLGMFIHQLTEEIRL